MDFLLACFIFDPKTQYVEAIYKFQWCIMKENKTQKSYLKKGDNWILAAQKYSLRDQFSTWMLNDSII